MGSEKLMDALIDEMTREEVDEELRAAGVTDADLKAMAATGRAMVAVCIENRQRGKRIASLERELSATTRLLAEERAVSKAAEQAHKMAAHTIASLRTRANAFDAISALIAEFDDASCSMDAIGEIVGRVHALGTEADGEGT